MRANPKIVAVVIAPLVLMALVACSGEPSKGEVSDACTGGAEHAYSVLRPSVVKITTNVAGGTGFVIGTGQIVTNAHVIARAGSVYVEFYDGRAEQVSVDYIRGDSEMDIAIIAVDTKAVPPVEVLDPDALSAGRDLVAVGYQLGLSGEPKVTKGVFSAHTEGFLQTDAAINLGNSGGPLADLCGRVVGVNTLKLDAENVGLAVPIDSAVEVWQVVQGGGGEPGSELSTPFGAGPYTMIIEKIGVNAPVATYGLDEDGIPVVPAGPEAAAVVAWYDFSAPPATGSNAVFSGHAYWLGPAVFHDLYQLQNGDEIRVEDENGAQAIYQVSSILVLDPNDPKSVEVMYPTDQEVITIVTVAGDYSTASFDYSHRLAIRADLITVL